MLVASLGTAESVRSQTLTQRGFVEGQGVFYPQEAVHDPTQVVGDLLIRDEAFLKPTGWLRLGGGAELRANSHDQVEDDWRVDYSDRGVLRPRISIRRASATISHKWLTVDIGKQFIRWGKTDILNPTDRFAPRDFLNVIDAPFLGVTGVRTMLQAGEHDSVDIVWVPRFTPSRIPLLDQRWTVLPNSGIQLVDAGAVMPSGQQGGIRWSRVGTRVEWSASFFDGFNNLPNFDARVSPGSSLAQKAGGDVIPVQVTRIYPDIRALGADVAMPLPWFSVKGETAYFTSSSPITDEYILYVIQLEKQTGEWVFVGGYAGEVITDRRSLLTFAPDRGFTKSFTGRASYTIDPARSFAVETAIHQNLRGEYFKAEYSQSYGQHWRTTVWGALIRGEPADFIGQYRLNSHISVVLRYSF